MAGMACGKCKNCNRPAEESKRACNKTHHPGRKCAR